MSTFGERAAARALFTEVWNDLGGERGERGERRDALHHCALAHAMADVQDDVRDELVWDLRALEAAESITDERAAAAGVTGPVAGFYPSLHLNLAECYRKLGDLDRAREHLHRGLASVDALSDGGYGRLIRAGLDRATQRLGPPG